MNPDVALSTMSITFAEYRFKNKPVSSVLINNLMTVNCLQQVKTC